MEKLTDASEGGVQEGKWLEQQNAEPTGHELADIPEHPQEETPSSEGANTGFVEYVQSGGNINDWFADATTKAAEAGDNEAAREILTDFVGAIAQWSERTWRGPIHWAYARYIAEAFQKILDGEDPSRALGIKRIRKGRRPGTKTYDEEGLAAGLSLLILNGFSATQAKELLHDRIGADIRTIEKAAASDFVSRIYRDSALNPQTGESEREFAVQVLKKAVEPYAAEIESILAGDRKNPI